MPARDTLAVHETMLSLIILLKTYCMSGEKAPQALAGIAMFRRAGKIADS
jgi:hypothetical protein